MVLFGVCAEGGRSETQCLFRPSATVSRIGLMESRVRRRRRCRGEFHRFGSLQLFSPDDDEKKNLFVTIQKGKNFGKKKISSEVNFIVTIIILTRAQYFFLVWPSATVSRDGLMESRLRCHCHWCGGPPPP